MSPKILHISGTTVKHRFFMVIVKRGKSWWTFLVLKHKLEGHTPEESERTRLWYRFTTSALKQEKSLCTAPSKCQSLPSLLFATHIIQKNRRLPPLSRPQRNGSPFLTDQKGVAICKSNSVNLKKSRINELKYFQTAWHETCCLISDRLRPPRGRSYIKTERMLIRNFEKKQVAVPWAWLEFCICYP